jgi:hypothetical protein
MPKKYHKPFILASAFVCFFSIACAEDTPLELSDEVRKSIVTEAAPKSWLREFEDWRDGVTDKYGTRFAVIINSQVQSSLYSKENEGITRAAWYYNIAIEQRLWRDSRLHFELEGGHNKGINKYFPTFSVLNSDAGELSYAYVTKLYLNQAFFNKKAFAAAGRLDLSDWFDVNAAANSSDTQFLASALVNNLTIPFPQKGLGAIINFAPRDWFYIQAGASDAKSVSTMVGLKDCFRGSFFIGEFGFLPKIRGQQGNYRFIFHYNHQKLGLISGDGSVRHDHGAALSFDQQVNRHLILFCRYGFAEQKVRKIWHFWSLGAELAEPIPGRFRDRLGLGMSQSIFGNDYRQADSAAQAETIYELYYNFHALPFFQVVPNLQIVTHPDADKDQSAIVIAGARAVVIF